MTTSDFEIGQELSNSQITRAFGGNIYQPIKISQEEKTIALLVNYADPRYENSWKGNVFHFSAFKHGAQGEQNWQYWPNRRLRDAAENGFRVFLFERYPNRKNYTFRGEVEVRGMEEHPLSLSSETKLAFLLHPIRHQVTENNPAILDVQISISNDEKYWTSYLLSQAPDLNLAQRDSPTEANVISSLWRAYASDMMDSFLADVELRAPGMFVAEYDLERGSIKGALTVVAAVAGITASAMSGLANYPKDKESWPIVTHDAKVAIKRAAEALGAKFPGVKIILESRVRRPPTRSPVDPTLGPPLFRREEDVVHEKRLPNDPI